MVERVTCPGCGDMPDPRGPFCAQCGHRLIIPDTGDAAVATSVAHSTSAYSIQDALRDADAVDPHQGGTNPQAVASLVLGILGLVLIPLVPSLIAMGLAASATREINSSEHETGQGLATAGMVLGLVGVFWGLFVVLALLAVT